MRATKNLTSWDLCYIIACCIHPYQIWNRHTQ